MDLHDESMYQTKYPGTQWHQRENEFEDFVGKNRSEQARRTEYDDDSDDMNEDDPDSASKTACTGNLFGLKNPLIMSPSVLHQGQLCEDNVVMKEEGAPFF